jgi:hypothetical protein
MSTSILRNSLEGVEGFFMLHDYCMPLVQFEKLPRGSRRNGSRREIITNYIK